MKKLTLVLLMLLMISIYGCGQPDVKTDFQESGTAHGSFSEMAVLEIETVAAPGEQYQPAIVSGCWSGVSLDGEPAEIKLRGNSSKESDKKAYTIKLEEEIALMGMNEGKKWALVSNPFDKSLIRPVIGFDYAELLGIEYTPETRLCKVWLDGRYMGVYTVVEPVEAGEGRVEINPDEGDFLLERNIGRYEEGATYMDSSAGLRFEFNEPEEPDDVSMEQCYRLLQQAETAILSGDHREYEKYIDVDSFVNFYIFHEVIKDVDFGEYSTRYYFKDGIMYAGPPWDLDLTMGNVSSEKEEFKYSSYNNLGESEDSSQGLWAYKSDYYYWLCKDPWFIEKVQQRWYAVRETTLNLAADSDFGDSLIDRYIEAHDKSLESNYTEAGWDLIQPDHMTEWQKPDSEYMGNVEMLQEWIIKRVAYLDSQFGPFVYTPALAII